ncbi:Glycosyl hydrolase, family 88, partial [human gut metagenome]
MKDYAKWMADSVIARKTDLTSYWAYEFGLTLDGIAEVGNKLKIPSILNILKSVWILL